MFKSSFSKEYTTLEEYVSRMKEDQKYIYFASGSSIARIEALPQTEMVRDKGYEILYFTDHVDEFTMQMMHDYNGKEFKSVSADDLGLETEDEKKAAEAAENQVEDSNKEATMTEDEMVEAAIRAGEEAADNDFKLKFEQAQKELADVRSELDAAAEAQKAAEDKAKDATERTARLQADWENFRRRTANERIAERERATEKLVTALLPVVDDIERAIDHARSQELSEDFKQFVDGVDAVHAKLLDVFAHEGVEPIDPKGEAFDPLEHQAVGRVEDASQYDETVNDVYQKGYRMADRILRSAMVTVTYGGEKRPAPEPEAAPEDASADTAESTEE